MKKIIVSLLFSVFLIPAKAQNTQYIAYYCKIWGLVKYYHADYMQGKKSIDTLFISNYAQLQTVYDDRSFNTFLNKLFQHVPESAIKATYKDKQNILTSKLSDVEAFSFLKDTSQYTYPILPDFSWLNADFIDVSIKDRLFAILTSYKPYPHINLHYAYKPEASMASLVHENNYHSIKNVSAIYGLLALFQYWNIVNYLYPYKNLMDESWDKALTEAIPEFMEIKNRNTYVLAMQRLVAKTNDSHSSLIDVENLKNYYSNDKWFIYPFETVLINDTLIITDTSQESIKVGDIILAINQKSISILKDSLTKLIPASTNQGFVHSFTYELLVKTYPDSAHFTFLRDKKIFYKTVKRILSTNYNPNIKNKKAPKFAKINENVAYINLCKITSKEEKRFYHTMQKCKAVILDLRGYPENDLSFLYSRLNKKIIDSTVLYVNAYNHLIGAFAKTTNEPIKRKNLKLYPTQRIVLINNEVISSAEGICDLIRFNSSHATFIGTPTIGSNGGVTSFQLLGNIRISCGWVYYGYLNGKTAQRKGIYPDIYVNPTLQGITDEKDEQLEKAIEIIKSVN